MQHDVDGTITIESLVNGTLRTSDKYQTEDLTIENTEAHDTVAEVAQFKSAEQTETDYSSIYASNQYRRLKHQKCRCDDCVAKRKRKHERK